VASSAIAKRAKDTAGALAARVAERLNGAPEAPAPVAQAPAPSREEIDNRHLELLIGWWLRPDSNCIDVGANEGRFLSHMATRAPDGHHFAFEPIPDLAEQLRTAFPDVDVHCAALYDEPGESEFVLVPELPGYSGLRERSYPKQLETRRIKVKLERLDDVLPEDYIPRMIKIDVEGAELQVLRGALRTLRQHRPLIVFEHGLGAADRYETTPEAMHELLTSEAGLRVYDMDAAGPLTREQFVELFNGGARWNFVAMP
jgi:FkbM family methyltransferase